MDGTFVCRVRMKKKEIHAYSVKMKWIFISRKHGKKLNISMNSIRFNTEFTN